VVLLIVCGSTFLRVILDEAHQIRNPKTRTHKACMLLRAERRWCLTGTPMQNSASDVGALLRFVGHDEAKNDWRIFRLMCSRVDCGDRSACVTLQTALKPLLLRRTKRTEIKGVPIFFVPPVQVLENDLHFGDDVTSFFFLCFCYFPLLSQERVLYSAVESRYITSFNRLDVGGKLQEMHQSVFAFILRLRQLCLHPLIFLFGKLRNFQNDEGEFLLKSRNKLDVNEMMQHYGAVLSFLKQGANFEGGAGLNVGLQKMIQFVMSTDDGAQECAICMDEIDYRNGRGDQKPMKTKCKHLFHDGCVRGEYFFYFLFFFLLLKCDQNGWSSTRRVRCAEPRCRTRSWCRCGCWTTAQTAARRFLAPSRRGSRRSAPRLCSTSRRCATRALTSPFFFPAFASEICRTCRCRGPTQSAFCRQWSG
jgi:hypothetical protein